MCGKLLIDLSLIGRVFLAFNKDTGDSFAIKQLALNSDIASAIEKEVHYYRTLKHKHLVGYLGTEVIPERGVFNILLEFCNGGSIAQMLKEA